MKLAAELARPDTGRTLYILDEPTTGLHFDDVRKLLDVLHRLADLGNTVVVIEHNLDVIKTADWIIDLGPEAGLGGGDLVGEGTPEAVVAGGQGHTARFLKPVLDAGPLAERPRFDAKAAARAAHEERQRARATPGVGVGGQWSVVGKDRDSSASPAAIPDAKAPWEVNGRKWHTRDRLAGNGRPARWDGRILGTVVDRIEAMGQGGFAPTEWSQRGVVRIKGNDETKVAFPFFHATTSAEWVVTLRFFVPKNTFRGNAVEKLLAMVPFHQVEPPVLSDLPRLRINDLGPFQEITIVGHGLADFETDGFEVFLKKAVTSFLGLGQRARIKTASELTG